MSKQQWRALGSGIDYQDVDRIREYYGKPGVFASMWPLVLACALGAFVWLLGVVALYILLKATG